MDLAGLAWTPSCLSLSVSCWLCMSLLAAFNAPDGLFASFFFLRILSVLYSLGNALFGLGLPFFPPKPEIAAFWIEASSSVLRSIELMFLCSFVPTSTFLVASR